MFMHNPKPSRARLICVKGKPTLNVIANCKEGGRKKVKKNKPERESLLYTKVNGLTSLESTDTGKLVC